MSNNATEDPLGGIPPDRRHALRDVESLLGRLRGTDGGGEVGLTDDALFVAEGDGPPVRVGFDDIVEVEVQTIDYFLVTMSLVLIGFGLYTTQSSLPGGVGIALIGVFNGYRTYQRRKRLIVTVSGRRKPLSVYPTDPDALFDALEAVASRDA
jgi:hypothetical protein